MSLEYLMLWVKYQLKERCFTFLYSINMEEFIQ